MLKHRADLLDELLQKALNTEVKDLTEGLFIHSKILRNGELCGFGEVKSDVLKSLRPANSNARSARRIAEKQKSQKKVSRERTKEIRHRRNTNGPAGDRKFSNVPSSLMSLNLVEEDDTVLLRTWVYDPAFDSLVEREETEEDLWNR